MGIPQDVAKGLDLFRTLIYDNIVEGLLTEYTAGLIHIPILGTFINSLILHFADDLYNKLGGVVIFGTILFVDVTHRQAFDAAETDLKLIALTKGIDSKEYRDAHEKEKQALKKLGQFGVAQPGIIK